MNKIDALTRQIVRFRDARDWEQFHTPKNLATALSIETGELQELMLWKTDKEVTRFVKTRNGRRECAAEIADVFAFALLFCHEIGIDPVQAVRSKLKKNALRYPVNLAKGNATKYTRLRKKTPSSRKE